MCGMNCRRHPFFLGTIPEFLKKKGNTTDEWVENTIVIKLSPIFTGCVLVDKTMLCEELFIGQPLVNGSVKSGQLDKKKGEN
jgi:hypothetical protein